MAFFLRTEEMFDLPFDCNTNDENDRGKKQKRITRWFSWFAFFVVGLAFKIAFRYRIKNKENVTNFKGRRGCIIIANHESYLDAAFMFLSLRPTCCPRIVARENLFKGKSFLQRQILSRAGAFPVSRNSADRTSLKRAVKMLKRNEMVFIMPEGTRRGKGTAELAIHSGFSFIAKMAGDAPIIPCAFRNVGKIKEKGKMIRFPKVEIEFGDPILLSDFNELEKRDIMPACSWYAMREVFALRDKVDSDKVDMNSLFPKDTDYSEVLSKIKVQHHTTSELAYAN